MHVYLKCMLQGTYLQNCKLILINVLLYYLPIFIFVSMNLSNQIVHTHIYIYIIGKLRSSIFIKSMHLYQLKNIYFRLFILSCHVVYIVHSPHPPLPSYNALTQQYFVQYVSVPCTFHVCNVLICIISYLIVHSNYCFWLHLGPRLNCHWQSLCPVISLIHGWVCHSITHQHSPSFHFFYIHIYIHIHIHLYISHWLNEKNNDETYIHYLQSVNPCMTFMGFSLTGRYAVNAYHLHLSW